MNDEIREELAAIIHELWAGWMTYLFGRCPQNADGSLVISAAYYQALYRQLTLPYADLREDEKESDRGEADRVIRVLTSYASEHGLIFLCEPSHRVLRAFREACEVEDCDQPRNGQTPYCKKHRMRHERHGDPTIVYKPFGRKKESV